MIILADSLCGYHLKLHSYMSYVILLYFLNMVNWICTKLLTVFLTLILLEKMCTHVRLDNFGGLTLCVVIT